MTDESIAQASLDPDDLFGFRAALEANQAKVEADQAEFLASFDRNMSAIPGKRAGASAAAAPRPQQRRATAAAAANTGAPNDQQPLFGAPVAQPVMLSPEEVAFKRQRLTTAYDPLNPPLDDPTTAEGVRMGVVTDADGRHWRQQSMRLGRWITNWKNTNPFASEPADVNQLSKAEKYWLDIKFRRRVPVRKAPIKMAQGRGCTGRYWSSRSRTRVVLSGRVNRASWTPASGASGSRNDDDPDDDADDDDADGILRPPPRPSRRPPTVSRRQASGTSGSSPGSSSSQNNSSTNTAPGIQLLRTSLINGVLQSYGIPSLNSQFVHSQLGALVTDEVLARLPPSPMVADIPVSVRTAMENFLQAVSLVSTRSGTPPTAVSGASPQTGLGVRLATTRAPERPQSGRGPLDDTGHGFNTTPGSSMEDFSRDLLAIKPAGQDTRADNRAQTVTGAAILGAVATSAATSTAATFGPGDAGGNFGSSGAASDTAAGNMVAVDAGPGNAGAGSAGAGNAGGGGAGAGDGGGSGTGGGGGTTIPEGLPGEDPNLELLFTRAGVARTDIDEDDLAMVTNALQAGAPGRNLSPASIASISNFIRGRQRTAGAVQPRNLWVWTTQPRSDGTRLRLRRMHRLFELDECLATDVEISQIRLEPGVIPQSNMRLTRHYDPDAAGQEVFVEETISHHYVRQGQTQPLEPTDPRNRDRRKGVPIFNRTVWNMAIPLGNQTAGSMIGAPATTEPPWPWQMPISPVFVDAARAAADQDRYWVTNAVGDRLSTRAIDDPGPRRFPSDQMERIMIYDGDDLSSQLEWVERRHISTGQRLWVREDRTNDYMLMGRRSPEPTRAVTLRTSSGIELRCHESAVGNDPDHNGAVIVSCDPEVSALEAPSAQLVWIESGDQRMGVPCNKLGNYINAVVNPPPRSNVSRMVTLSPDPPGPDIMVPEALVGTRPEHANAIIRGCNLAVDESEPPSQRTVQVLHDGSLENVPDNKLGSYFGGLVNPPDESTQIPPPLGRTIDLRQSSGVDISVPVSDVDNFGYGSAIILANSNPPASNLEQLSGRLVWINQQTDEGIMSIEVDDNQLGLYDGCTICPPKPVPPNRTVRFARPGEATGSLPVSDLSNLRHQGGVIFETEPAYDSLEMPSGRLVRISTVPDMVDIAVHDNQLGRHLGATILGPSAPPANPLTQANPSLPTNNSSATNTSQARPPAQTSANSQTNRPTQTNFPQGISEDAETNVQYSTDLNAPEFVQPSRKPFPTGRPDKDGNIPPPRPPRGDPEEVERLRMVRENAIRREAVQEYIASTTVRLDSLIGSVTIRAGGAAAAAATTAQQQPRPMVQGTSRANVADATRTAPATPARPRAMKKSARVAKPGRGPGAGRNVRFDRLPAEEEEVVGRTRGSGLTTRSGAQKRSGSGSGSGSR